jgi:hypothetical protein
MDRLGSISPVSRLICAPTGHISWAAGGARARVARAGRRYVGRT